MTSKSIKTYGTFFPFDPANPPFDEFIMIAYREAPGSKDILYDVGRFYYDDDIPAGVVIRWSGDDCYHYDGILGYQYVAEFEGEV